MKFWVVTLLHESDDMLEELYLYELAISYKRIRHYYSRTSVLFRKKEIYKMA